MTTVVFSGSTLAPDPALGPADAVWRPTARPGDVAGAVADGAHTICLIDVTAHLGLPHQECIHACEAGIRVLAGGGRGAARAVELRAHGVQGVGQVFEAFVASHARTGVIDDAAFAIADDVTGTRLEAPRMLVDSSLALQEAVAANLVERELADAWMVRLASLPLAQRTFARLLEWSTSGRGVVHDGLERFLAEHVPASRRDATAVLRRAAAAPEPACHGAAPRAVGARPLLLDRVISRIDHQRASPGCVLPDRPPVHPQRGAHLDQLQRGGETLKVVRKKVLLRLLARREMERQGRELSTDLLEAQAKRFRQQFRLVTRDDMTTWMRDEGLSAADFEEVMRDFAIITELEAEYGAQIERLVPQHIRINTARDWLAAVEAR